MAHIHPLRASQYTAWVKSDEIADELVQQEITKNRSCFDLKCVPQPYAFAPDALAASIIISNTEQNNKN